MVQTVNVPFIGSINFPDDMSSEDMKSAIDEKYPQAPMLAQHAKMIQENAKEASTFNERHSSIGQNLGAGFIGGLTKTGEGWNQLLSGLYEKVGLLPSGSQQSVTNRENARQAAFNQGGAQNTWAGWVGDIAGQAAPFTALPAGGAGIASRVALGGLGGTLQGGSTFLPDLKNEAEDRRTNAEIGGTIGAILPQIPPALMGGYSRIANTVRNKASTPEIQALKEFADSNELPIYAQDLSENPTIQMVGKRLEDMPSGMTGARAAQAESAADFARTLPEEYKGALDATQYGNLDEIQKVAAAGGKRGAKAQQLLAQIANTTDDDWHQIVNNSRDAKGFGYQLGADRDYDLVETAAQKAGDFIPENTVKTLQETVDEMSKRVMPENPGFQQLQGILRKLQSEPSPIAGVESSVMPKPISFTEMRNLRSDLGALVKSYYTGNNTMIGAQGVANLQKAKNAVNEDMEAFAKKGGGELYDLWKTADKNYLEYVVPYKNRALANSSNPDGIYGAFIKNGFETGKPEQLFKGLDEKGQAAVRYGMIKNAFQKSYDEQLQKFSPASFNSSLQRQMGARDIFFSGKNKAQLEGFLNYLAHIKGSANAVGEKKAATGIRAVPFLVYGELGHQMLTNPASAVGQIATMQGLRLLFTTKWGRNFLTAASHTRPNSKTMDRLVNSTTQVMTNALTRASAGGQDVPKQQK